MTDFSSRLSRFRVFERLDSTNARAAGLARHGETGPVWVLALRQTAGYGRRGRSWSHLAGDFAGSFLFLPDIPVCAFGQLSFVTALAVYDTLCQRIPEKSLRIKWPNDLLADHAKICGLLLETVRSGDKTVMVAGIGINIVSGDRNVPYKTACMHDYGCDVSVSPEVLARDLDRAFRYYYSIFHMNGFSAIRDTVLERMAGTGQEIRVTTAGGTIAGIMETLDHSGGLVLRTQDGIRTVNSGDVYFGAGNAGERAGAGAGVSC